MARQRHDGSRATMLSYASCGGRWQAWTDEDTRQGEAHRVTYTGEALAILRWFAEPRDLPPSRKTACLLTKDGLDGTWIARAR
jgi:hypothetical protein